MSIEPAPRYSWRPTWPEVKDDFVGFDGARKFARIHRHHMGNWLWFLTMEQPFFDGGVMAPLTGAADTARQAAAAVERCYDLVMSGEWPGMTERDREVAARLRASGSVHVELRAPDQSST